MFDVVVAFGLCFGYSLFSMVYACCDSAFHGVLLSVGVSAVCVCVCVFGQCFVRFYVS